MPKWFVAVGVIVTCFVVLIANPSTSPRAKQLARKSDEARGPAGREDDRASILRIEVSRSAPTAVHPLDTGENDVRLSKPLRQQVLAVRIVDDNGAPIPGAVCRQAPAWSVIGTADQSGRTKVALENEQGDITITAPKFAVRHCELPRYRDGSEVIVVLEQEGVILGRAVDTLGRPAVEGLRVVAQPLGAAPEGDSLLRALDGGGPVKGCTTSADGTFRLEGLILGERYQILVAGNGLLGVARQVISAPASTVDASDGVVVSLSTVYGIILNVLEEGGEALRLSPLLRGRWVGTPRPLDSSVGIVPADGLIPLLLGRPGSGDYRGGPYSRLFLFVTSAPLGDSIDLKFQAQVPGYQEFDGLVAARRVTSSVAKVDIELAREVGGGFGALELRLMPLEFADTALPSPPNQSQLPELVLTDVETGKELHAELSEIGRGFQRIEGVPYGVYRARFSGPGRFFEWRGADEGPVFVNVGPQTAEFEVDIRGLGSFQLKGRFADGTGYSGPIRGVIYRLVDASPEPVDSAHFSLARRPYCLPFIPSGDYRVELTIPGVISPAGRLRVDGGRTTVVDFQLD